MLLTIEKMIYGGDGLARLPADPAMRDERGKAVFVPFVLPGEQVEARIVEEKPGFARAQAERVVSSSPLRVEPQCPYYQRCGGCHYQHTDYEHQLEIKTAILRENLRRLAKLEWPGEIVVHPSPPWNYRNRTRLQVRTEPEFMLGYYKFGSHELLPVEQCPISSPLINRAIGAVLEAGRARQLPAGASEIEFFADAADRHLLVEVYAEAGATEWVNALQPSVPEVSTVAVRRQASTAEAAVPHESAGQEALQYATQNDGYRVSAGSFFQTNRHLIDELINIVTAGQSGALALDLYAGVGLFTLPLARTFERVVAVESAENSHADLVHNAPANVKCVRATTQEYLQKAKGRRPDFVVVDPPRAGLGASVVKSLVALAPRRLTYVSCDPATLGRDLKGLLEGGFRVAEVHLVDLFPQTFHLESVIHLSR